MIERFQRVIFYTLVLVLPVQLGVHFWPQFSFINGIRVDYLSPTLYLSDIFIILLLPFFLTGIFRKKIKVKISKQYLLSIAVFLGAVFLTLFIAKSPLAHLFILIKILEFVFLGIYTATNFKKNDIPFFVDALSIGAVFSSILAFWQFFIQGSVGGAWYFIGERFFTKFSPGIALADINNTAILRPYAAFAHPNILAFFLLAVIIFVLMRLSWEKGLEKLFLIFVMALSTLALLSTFSRVAIFCFMLFLIYYVYILIKKKTKPYLPVLFLLSIFVYFFYFSERFFNLSFLLRDYLFRQDLFLIAYSIFIKNPYLGIGFGNFYSHEALYQKTVSPTLLQPVHNVYIMLIVEAGIFAFVLIIQFILGTFRRLFLTVKKTKKEIKDFYISILFYFLCLVFVGFFDHFLITLQQGELLLAIIAGLAWTNLKVKVPGSVKAVRGAGK